MLKGLKDLKLKLTENADIVQKYMEAVEKFLPGMTAILGLTVSDFTLDMMARFGLQGWRQPSCLSFGSERVLLFLPVPSFRTTETPMCCDPVSIPRYPGCTVLPVL